MDTITFTVNGRQMSLDRSTVEDAVRNAVPEPIRSHGVVVDDTQYPVKQVFALSTGLDRLDFTSGVARRQLDKLGFEVVRRSDSE